MSDAADSGISQIEALGSLHDAWIDTFFVDVENEIFKLDIPNATTAILDSDGHPPPCRGATFMFGGVSEIYVDVEFSELIRISELRVTSCEGFFRLEIDMNLGGGATSRGKNSIVAIFKSIQILWH